MQLPLCRETVADVQSRFTTTLQKIANKFHFQHILCITHGMPLRFLKDIRSTSSIALCNLMIIILSICVGEGVMNSMSMMWPRVEMYGVDYCAYIHAQRPNFERDDGTNNILSGEWELLTESGSSSGIFFGPPQ